MVPSRDAVTCQQVGSVCECVRPFVREDKVVREMRGGNDGLTSPLDICTGGQARTRLPAHAITDGRREETQKSGPCNSSTDDAAWRGL